MIKPTDSDRGRRVRLTTMPDTVGMLMSVGTCRICGGHAVLYDGNKTSIHTDPEKLQWADGDLL